LVLYAQVKNNKNYFSGQGKPKLIHCSFLRLTNQIFYFKNFLSVTQFFGSIFDFEFFYTPLLTWENFPGVHPSQDFYKANTLTYEILNIGPPEKENTTLVR